MPTRRKTIYFLSLELKNVRCFAESQVLSLVDSSGRPARWTLLVGDNGVGKTTLLQCLAWIAPDAVLLYCHGARRHPTIATRSGSSCHG